MPTETEIGDTSTMLDKAKSFVRQWDGPLTRDLLREPGKFGLGAVPSKLKPDGTTTSICGYCSTGCGLTIHVKDGSAVNLSPTTKYPVNLGMACPKGWEALKPLDAPDRATTPYRRNSRGKLVPTDWDTALNTFTTRFKHIQEEYGPESVAFISTGQIPSEEMAYLGALTKFGMGIKHGDGNTRQCMSTAVVSYKESFGFDAPPYTYKDFEASDVIVLIGSNLCIAHPIMWERVMLNPNNPEIIVVDPRKTETAVAATQHYPLAPKSDLALFYGIANLLIHMDAVDLGFIRKHTNRYDDFAEHIESYTTDIVAEATGLTKEQLRHFAETIASGKRVSFWWTMGVNQSHEGVRVAQSIINLALMTGNIGRPGTGANSITGQCNAMGSRLFSNTTNLLGGHDFGNPQHRRKVADALDIDSAHIPTELGLAYDQIIDAIGNNKIKGLWIIATNSAHSWINQLNLRQIFKNLEFVVVQDMYHTTESAEIADLVLPAGGWGEKDGTFINSERRIGLVKRVRKPPGQAMSDFNIFRAIAKYWGCDHMFTKWRTPENVFSTLRDLTKDQPCDFSGIRDYEMIDRSGGVQWPFPSHMPVSEKEAVLPQHTQRRLFEDNQFYHADKRAKFIFEAPRKLPEATCERYPFVLITGRGTSAQWHTQTRTGKSDILKKLYPNDIYVEINPRDARSLGITPNEWVFIISRRGKIKARAALTYIVQPNQVFVPMHYKETNHLTFPAFDPYSRQPSYKHCAVRIEQIPHWA